MIKLADFKYEAQWHKKKIKHVLFCSLILFSFIVINAKNIAGENMNDINKNLYKIILKYSDDEDQEPISVGMVLITKEHILEAKPIDSPYKELLIEIVSLIDKEPFLHLDAHPPSEKGRVPAEQLSRIVKKSDPEYAAAVEQTLENTYSFIVVRNNE